MPIMVIPVVYWGLTELEEPNPWLIDNLMGHLMAFDPIIS